eukprot:763379-Lingulodinium_polyedra.AAC.1
MSFSWLLSEPKCRKLHEWNVELLAKTSGGAKKRLSETKGQASKKEAKKAKDAKQAAREAEDDLADLFG